MDTILITGANRGLGLEFTKQYAESKQQVIACTRNLNDAAELKKLSEKHANISIEILDITDEKSIQALKQKIQHPIDILLNNAGTLHTDALGKVSIDDCIDTFRINTIAPIKMIEAFKDHVAKSQRKLVAALSSSMGSIHDNTSGGYYSYRASKAALNMMMKSAAIDLASLGIKVLLLHPGWVKTRMGGIDATLKPQDSIAGMRKVIENYNPQLGEVKFHRYNGEIIEW